MITQVQVIVLDSSKISCNKLLRTLTLLLLELTSAVHSCRGVSVDGVACDLFRRVGAAFAGSGVGFGLIGRADPLKRRRRGRLLKDAKAVRKVVRLLQDQ